MLICVKVGFWYPLILFFSSSFYFFASSTGSSSSWVSSHMPIESISLDPKETFKASGSSDYRSDFTSIIGCSSSCKFCLYLIYEFLIILISSCEATDPVFESISLTLANSTFSFIREPSLTGSCYPEAFNGSIDPYWSMLTDPVP